MPRAAAVPAELRARVFRGSDVVDAGLLTAEQLRSTAWTRLFRDVYVHRDFPVTHALRARAAAAFVVPGAVVSGRSAASLWGIELVGPAADVELTVPPEQRIRVQGVRVRRRSLAVHQVCRRRGVATTTPVATAVELAMTLPVHDAVVALDVMLGRGLVDPQPLQAAVEKATGPGSARARRACALADGRSESPQETRLRLTLARHGLPPPVLQHVVRDDAGRHVARVDFAWPEHKVAVEYDGLWHGEAGQFARDRQRLNRLHAAGWRVVFVTAADLHRPAEVLARIGQLLGHVVTDRGLTQR